MDKGSALSNLMQRDKHEAVDILRKVEAALLSMLDPIEQYIDEVRKDFVRFGFIEQPLDKDEIILCYHEGLSLYDTYGVGCDVYAGFDFDHALRANTPAVHWEWDDNYGL